MEPQRYREATSELFPSHRQEGHKNRHPKDRHSQSTQEENEPESMHRHNDLPLSQSIADRHPCDLPTL